MKKISQNKIWESAWHYGVILLGAAILSFGLYNVHSQSMITEGGVLGMTLLLQNWFGITPGITGIILDSVCYFFGYKMLGKKFLKNALVASVGFSLCYNLYSAFGYVLPDMSKQPFLAAVVGGIFVGVGVGLIVRRGGASGGDDALALIITKVTKCKISRAYLVTDVVVLVLSLTYIPFNKIVCSLITVTISSIIIGKIHESKKVLPRKKSEFSGSLFG